MGEPQEGEIACLRAELADRAREYESLMQLAHSDREGREKAEEAMRG